MGCAYVLRAAVFVDIIVDRRLQPVYLYFRVRYMCIQINLGRRTVDPLRKGCRYGAKGVPAGILDITTMATYKSSGCNGQQFSSLRMPYSWSSCSPHDVVISNGSCQTTLATAVQNHFH